MYKIALWAAIIFLQIFNTAAYDFGNNIIAILSRDEVVSINQRILLTCVVFGNHTSNLSVKWQKNNKTITHGGTYCIAEREVTQGEFKFLQLFLQITSIQCDHEGVYTCQASNGVINSESPLTLLIRDSPKIVATSEVAVAHINEDARLVCMAYSPSGSKLNFTWHSKGLTIANMSANIIQDDDFYYHNRRYTVSVLHRCHTPIPLSLNDNSFISCKVTETCSKESIIDLVVYEDPLYFQLALRLPSDDCEKWQSNSFAEDVSRIVSAAIKEQRDNCQTVDMICKLDRTDLISSPSMSCYSDQLHGYILYRAQINGTRNVTVERVMKVIESWVLSGPLISVQSELFSVHASCNVQIQSLDEPPCDVRDLGEKPNDFLEPEITGAIVLIIAFTICTLIAIVTVVVLRRKAKIARTSAVYSIVDNYQLMHFGDALYEDLSEYHRESGTGLRSRLTLNRNSVYERVDDGSYALLLGGGPDQIYEKVDETSKMAVTQTEQSKDVYERIDDDNYELTENAAYTSGKGGVKSKNYYNMKEMSTTNDDYAFTDCAAYSVGGNPSSLKEDKEYVNDNAGIESGTYAFTQCAAYDRVDQSSCKQTEDNNDKPEDARRSTADEYALTACAAYSPMTKYAAADLKDNEISGCADASAGYDDIIIVKPESGQVKCQLAGNEDNAGTTGSGQEQDTATE